MGVYVFSLVLICCLINSIVAQENLNQQIATIGNLTKEQPFSPVTVPKDEGET